MSAPQENLVDEPEMCVEGQGPSGNYKASEHALHDREEPDEQERAQEWELMPTLFASQTQLDEGEGGGRKSQTSRQTNHTRNAVVEDATA